MSKEFDYATAWKELAVPAMKALDSFQRTAIQSLVPQLVELHQGKDLNIPISDLMRKDLQPLSDKQIAEISQVCHDYTHWKPSKTVGVQWISADFCGWKIANVCDQILKLRFDDLRNLLIIEGKFRATYSDINNWIWNEWGLATEANFEFYKNCGLSFSLNKIEESYEILKRTCPDKMWDTNSYNVWEKGSKEAAFQSIFPKNDFVYFEEFMTINHKPHPYVIGNMHLEHSDGILNEASIKRAEQKGAHCYYKESQFDRSFCNLDYSEHTSEQAIKLKLKQNTTFKDIQPILLQMKPYLEENKYSGFAFNVNGFTLEN